MVIPGFKILDAGVARIFLPDEIRDRTQEGLRRIAGCETCQIRPAEPPLLTKREANGDQTFDLSCPSLVNGKLPYGTPRTNLGQGSCEKQVRQS